MFRDSENYHEYRESLCEDNADGEWSECCQGTPIGNCFKCGIVICEDHGVTDESGYTWCEGHAPEPEEEESTPRLRFTITPMQVALLASASGAWWAW